MILSDLELKHMIKSKRLVIEPLSDKTVQQNGVDLRATNQIAKRLKTERLIDSSSNDEIASSFKIESSINKHFIIDPCSHFLFNTLEQIKMPNDIIGFCGLRSTFARLGFMSPLTIIDAGFEGTLTIGAFYGGCVPIKIPVNCRFLHVVFAKMSKSAKRPYRGRYQNQEGISLPQAVL